MYFFTNFQAGVFFRHSRFLKPLSSDFVEENFVFFCYFNLTPNIVTSQVKPDRIFFNFSSLDAQIHLSIEKKTWWNIFRKFPLQKISNLAELSVGVKSPTNLSSFSRMTPFSVTHSLSLCSSSIYDKKNLDVTSRQSHWFRDCQMPGPEKNFSGKKKPDKIMKNTSYVE